MRVLGTLLEGSGKYFAVCILLGLLLTVVEMIAPQVIRVTVDSVIDSKPMDLPAWALRWVASLGGVDIADMPARYVRENVGVVLQEPFLFSRSVQENIGICGASDAEIRAAAVTACVDGDITRFSQGYDTMVGERGVSLSGGQKQRVAIARMLTKKTPVIVFDDSLSAVDTETDEKIRSALDRDLGGATTIIISHRITTLLDCDNILVLEKGRVSQLGSPKELLAQPGIFRKIYDMQMSIGEEEGA